MKKHLALFISFLIIASLFAVVLSACNDAKPLGEPAKFELNADRDYGLLWYNDEGNTMLSEENMPTEYYDPAKPTVIYSHGWKEDLSAEELVTQQSTISATGGVSGDRNYASELRKAGYNVGYFDWHLYAAELGALLNEIWITYDASDENAAAPAPDSNYAEALAALDGRSFAGEFAREVATVMKGARSSDLHFIGHSYGAQMVTAAAYTLNKMYDAGLVVNKNCIPTRISLADPYIPSSDLSGKMDIIEEPVNAYLPQLNADVFAFLRQRGTFIDIYGAMNIIYGSFEGEPEGTEIGRNIRANTAFVTLDGMNKEFPLMSARHVNARDYVLTNLVDSIAGKIDSLPFTLTTSAKDGSKFVGLEFSQKGPGFDWAKTYYSVK